MFGQLETPYTAVSYLLNFQFDAFILSFVLLSQG